MTGCLMAWLFALAAFNSGAAESIVELNSVTVEHADSHLNLLPNPGFEEGETAGIPAGWSWSHGSTDATCSLDRNVAHHGRQSAFFKNGTPFGPNIFGSLWISKPVRITEGKTYTMSAWVKTKSPGVFTLIGGGAWLYRVSVSVGDNEWHRISKTFKAEANDCDFTFRINTESETSGVWVDDVKLEEGNDATDDLTAEGIALESGLAEKTIQGDGSFSVDFLLNAAKAVSGDLTVKLENGTPLNQEVKKDAGLWKLVVKGTAICANNEPTNLVISLNQNGKETSTARAALRFYSPSNALVRLAGLRSQLPALKAELKTIKSKKQDVSYPTITATVLENFIGYAEEDAHRGEVRRSIEQVLDMEKMAKRLGKELKESLDGHRKFASVPRWTGTKRPVIKSSAFLAPACYPGKPARERPVFFTGYGHFNQVVSDMEKWPDYGANIIQIEIGPSRVFPEEGKTNTAAVDDIVKILDRAQKSGVAVCLLISPHYFPQWALNKWPELKVHRDGFLGYCIHDPRGRELLQAFIRVLVEPIKNHPALHSICLSNEPVNQESPCEPARKEWCEWLEKCHTNIAVLNSLSGSNFTSFAMVPLPDPFGARPASALWMDYVRFNQDEFAGWHKMLADAVHEVAPALPVHAKAMTWTMVSDVDVKLGVDATLFAKFSNINGNDSANMYHFGMGEFAQDWELNAYTHDLQRSVLDAPIFNTENHLITDRDTRWVPAAHIRAGLWQAAVHGQSATTIWVWERTFDANSDFSGSIMHRPECAEIVGVTGYDLNRAAYEMTAIQQAPAQVLMLQSVTSQTLDFGNGLDTGRKLYTALSFTGLKIGFVTERQLEAGFVPQAPVVFISGMVHMSDAAVKGLEKYQGRIVSAGGDRVLKKDEYDRERKLNLTIEKIDDGSASVTALNLREKILARLPEWKIRPAVELLEKDQHPAWGVEWRSALTGGKTVVNLCNYRNQTALVFLAQNGKKVRGRDVLTGARVSGPFALEPLEVRLIRLE